MSAASDFDNMIMEFMADDPMIAFYIKTVDGPYDYETSTMPQVITEIPCKAILLDDISSNNGFSSKFNTMIQAGDKQLYLLPPEKADLNATPMVIDPANDRVRIANVTYKVQIMKEANPTGTSSLLYNFLLRR